MLHKFTAFTLMAVAVSAASADVNIPRGYYLVNLTENEGFNRWCSINNHGQIVWSTGFNPFDGGTYEIMMYDRGEIRQITNNAVFDDYPDINDNGTIVWSSRTGPGGRLEIWQYHAGVTSKLQDEWSEASPQDNRTPVINDSGHVVWSRTVAEPVCDYADTELWMYDGISSFQLTLGGASNQSPQISNAGDIVWTKYGFCVSPWTSQTLLMRNGTSQVISPADQMQPQGPVISNAGTVYWASAAPPEIGHEVSKWRGGQVSQVTPWGSVARVSDSGQLTITRWVESSQTWQLFLLRAGEFIQLTDDEFWNFTGAINNRTEIAWTYGEYPYYQTRALLRHQVGDLNCDGVIGLGDIAGFVQALTRPEVYDEQHPTCDAQLADANENGVLSVGDIASFVALLLAP